MNVHDADVLVVGAGPTGLALGIELRRHGVDCRLIDKLDEPANIAKASGIMPRTMEVFEAQGVIDEFLSCGERVNGFVAYGNGGTELVAVDFDTVEAPYPFVLGLEQYQTEALLRKRFEELGGIIERGVELVDLEDTGESVRVCLRDSEGVKRSTVSYVVGCDGAHSTVRHQLELSFHGASYPQDFILGHMRMDWPVPRDHMTVFMTRHGMLFASPVPEDDRWLVVGDLSGAQTELVHDGAPTIDDLQAVLDERAPEGTVASAAKWTSFFRIHHRQVDTYARGRVFVCGDAAHIHTPLGGQGMNTGIQDAFNLGWKLGLVLDGRAQASLLETYDPERRPVGKHVLDSTNEMQVATSWRNPALQKVRNSLAKAAGHLQIVRHAMVAEMGETAYTYRRGPLAHEHIDGGLHLHYDARHPGFKDVRAFHHGPCAGDRAPDAADEQVRLYDHLGSTRFKLLLFEGTHASDADVADLAQVADDVRERGAGLVDVLVVTPHASDGRNGHVADPEQTIHHEYGARGQCQVLVRPDGYIGYRSQPVDADRLFGYFETIGVS